MITRTITPVYPGAMLFLLLATGCSTTPTPLADSATIPWSRVLAFKHAPQQDPVASVVFIRDSGLSGRGCFWSIAVNETRAARIGAGEKVVLFVPPGEINLAVAGGDVDGGGICDYTAHDWANYFTTIQAGEIQYFRVGMGTNPQVWIPLYGLFVEHRGAFIEPYQLE